MQREQAPQRHSHTGTYDEQTMDQTFVEMILCTIFIHSRGGRRLAHLVAHEADLHPAAVRVVPDVLHPVGDVAQGLGVRHVVHQDDAVRAAIVRLRYLVETLLHRDDTRDTQARAIVADELSSVKGSLWRVRSLEACSLSHVHGC